MKKSYVMSMYLKLALQNISWNQIGRYVHMKNLEDSHSLYVCNEQIFREIKCTQLNLQYENYSKLSKCGKVLHVTLYVCTYI